MKVRDFILVVLSIISMVLVYKEVLAPKTDNGGVVQPVQPIVQPVIQPVQPTQPAVQPVVQPVIQPTWTPFYIAPVVIPVQPDNHIRTSVTPGTIGNHDTGRTDSRTP